METNLKNKVKTSEDLSAGYREKIHKIALNTFELTCYMFPLEEWELEDTGDLQEPDGSMRAIVRFDGAAEGGMLISASADLLNAIAANMLGIEEAADTEKQGALTEIANIICGNTVPLFADNENICYIRPPRIAENTEDFNQLFKGMPSDEIRVLLDEGIADITIYYKAGV